MQYQLTTTGAIKCAATNSIIPVDGGNSDYQEYLRWVAQGNTPVPAQAPQLTPDQQLASFISAIQNRLDEFAKTRGYSHLLSAITYANSTVPKFAAEGQYALRIRDETWIRWFALEDEIKAGTRPMPASNEELFALLPKLEWPK